MICRTFYNIIYNLDLNPGDEVVVIGPVWPNIYSAISINRGIATHASISLEDNAWNLNLRDVFAAVSPKTKAIFLNSPGNPTGWIMPEEDQKEFLKKIALKQISMQVELQSKRPSRQEKKKYAL